MKVRAVCRLQSVHRACPSADANKAIEDQEVDHCKDSNIQYRAVWNLYIREDWSLEYHGTIAQLEGHGVDQMPIVEFWTWENKTRLWWLVSWVEIQATMVRLGVDNILHSQSLWFMYISIIVVQHVHVEWQTAQLVPFSADWFTQGIRNRRAFEFPVSRDSEVTYSRFPNPE